jgi:hypothetical protein
MKTLHKYLFMALALSVATAFTACSDDDPGDELTAPQLSTDGANNVARTTCTVAGIYSGNLSKISEYGVKYSTSNNFPTDATTVVTFSGKPATNVKAELEGLSPNTHYYYCWYASTGKTVVSSTYGEFTTTSTSKPAFSEITVDSVGENYMRLRCRVTDVGDQYLVEQGISYRAQTATASFTQASADQVDANNEFTVELNDLTASTTYEIRPYAKNSADSKGESGMLEGYGDTQTVTTDEKLSPELETYAATDVTMNSARLLAKVTSAKASLGVITERGFCYSTESQNPTIYDNAVVVDGLTLGEVFETTLTGLSQLTTYYVRPYAKNIVNWQERVGYGEAIEFTTTQITSPQVSITNQDAVKVTTTTVSLYAQIDNYYPTALQERGFIWSADDKNISISNAKSQGNYLAVTSTDKLYSGTIGGLEPGTNYYIRAYAIYQVSGETLSGVSEMVSYTTDDVKAASFKDLTCTAKTSTSLSVSTGISDMGDGTFSEKGFCWRAGSGVTVTLGKCDGSIAVNSSDNYSYSATLTDLQQATGYTVRGYVKTTYNSQTIIGYSEAQYFTTEDVVAASMKSVTASLTDDTTISAASGISNLGSGELVERGFCWKAGSAPTLDDCDGSVAVTDGTDSSFSASITGLSYSTTYYIRSYAKTTLDGVTSVTYSSSATCATKKIPTKDDIDNPDIKK